MPPLESTAGEPELCGYRAPSSQLLGARSMHSTRWKTARGHGDVGIRRGGPKRARRIRDKRVTSVCL